MKVKLLYTTGKNDLCETIWNKPDPAKDEIEVKADYRVRQESIKNF